MDNTPIILTGSPGCGKSYWIQKYAETIKKQLFVCPCRKDRTLRDGRQKLHIWARRTEPAILWLEGADDLTPEAQAFLRRILETHASDVLFILECRDAGRLQEPIRSRCKIKRIHPPTWTELEQYLQREHQCSRIQIEEIKTYLRKNEYSYRRAKHCAFLQLDYPEVWKETMEHRMKEEQEIPNLSPDRLIDYIKAGYHPETFIHSLLSDEQLLKDYGTCMEVSGSLWAFLGSALHRRALDDASTTTDKKEE
uniref:ATPase AAA-type core domain-containing protein n=1 Tax=viral metagenome TaxID=1070528 RepID=A0A6C0KRW7_9ZZZZ